MCWCTEHKTFTHLHIANEDITVYKIVLKRDPSTVVSFYRKHIYKLGQLNEEVCIDVCCHWNGTYVINEGYHSYYTMDKCNANLCFGQVIVECTIPKGSIFYVNGCNEVVSENIIINKIIE